MSILRDPGTARRDDAIFSADSIVSGESLQNDYLAYLFRSRVVCVEVLRVTPVNTPLEYNATLINSRQSEEIRRPNSSYSTHLTDGLQN